EDDLAVAGGCPRRADRRAEPLPLAASAAAETDRRGHREDERPSSSVAWGAMLRGRTFGVEAERDRGEIAAQAIGRQCQPGVAQQIARDLRLQSNQEPCGSVLW